jgi:D-erythrulose 1-phosphate 3-epimerase
MPDSPQIYLAVDNCFASRRWADPADWAAVVRDLGLAYVEASADNEIDPLYTTPDYMADWIAQVEAVRERTSVAVANLYSGHGTYATTGLAHTDARVADRILYDWLMVMAEVAGRLDSGLGFACHAFSEPILQDLSAYRRAEDDLVRRLAVLARRAQAAGTKGIGVEQMYAPHMIPWTVAGAEDLLRRIYGEGGAPFYLTIDTGHACGQRKFLQPDAERMVDELAGRYATGSVAGLWLGPRRAYDAFRRALAAPPAEAGPLLAQVAEEMAACPYMFAQKEDGDPYVWLARLGAYSPIIHLQQTDGRASAHRPFTVQFNGTGIIDPPRVLAALANAYASAPAPGLPPRCTRIYLTIEVFAATADLPVDILAGLQESVAYWRQWVPEDGLTLEQLLTRLPVSHGEGGLS